MEIGQRKSIIYVGMRPCAKAHRLSENDRENICTRRALNCKLGRFGLELHMLNAVPSVVLGRI